MRPLPERAVPGAIATAPRSRREGSRSAGARGSGALIVAALIVGFLLFRDACSRTSTSQELLEDLSEGARRLDLPARRRPGLPRDRRLRRPGRAGEFTVILGGAVAGQGDISLPADPRRSPGSRPGAGDSVSFMLGRGWAAASWSATGHRVRITEERV